MSKAFYYFILSTNIEFYFESKIKYFMLVILLFLSLYSCSISEETREESLPTLAIEVAFSQKNYIKLSEFTQGDIEYIRLETKQECIIGNYSRFYADTLHIIALTQYQMFLFDRRTGKFIRQIGHQGRDPGGYWTTQVTYPYDESMNLLFANGWRLGIYLVYDLYGTFKTHLTPREGNISMAPLNDSLYVAYIKNFTGTEKEKLVIFDNQNNSIKTFPNYLEAEEHQEAAWFTTQGWFYKYKDRICFYELFTDTIFHVTLDELIPRFVFDLGNFAPPYDRQGLREFIADEIKKYYHPGKIFESDNYLVFEILHENVTHIAIYNKETEKIALAESAEGFENDLDNFIPMNYNFLNSHSELIGSWEAYKIDQWFKDNPEKAAQLPTHLKEFKKLTEDDNPVVMIVRLKD